MECQKRILCRRPHGCRVHRSRRHHRSAAWRYQKSSFRFSCFKL